MQTCLLTTLDAIGERVAASARLAAAAVFLGALSVGAAQAQVFAPDLLRDSDAEGLAAVYADAGGGEYVAVIAEAGRGGAEEVAFDGCAAALEGGEPETRFVFDGEGRLSASVFNHAQSRVEYTPPAPHLIEGRFQVIARLQPLSGGGGDSGAAIFEIERRDLGVVTFLRVTESRSRGGPTIVTLEGGAVVTVLATSASGGPMAVMQRLRGPAPLAEVCG